MRFGITGNTSKDILWNAVSDFIQRMDASGREFLLSRYLAEGLFERELLDRNAFAGRTSERLAGEVDVVLSFGGDGTLLNTAHEIGDQSTPILGVNLGRLGFMTHIEMATLDAAVERLEAGDFRIEDRLVLRAEDPVASNAGYDWALNEFTIQRSREAGLLTLEVHVDGKLLNTFWADGLVIATPTGSTAYSLALGGPIMMPGCGAILITPIAPHTLTVRPIVIPDTSAIEVRVLDSEKPHIHTSDGVNVDLTNVDSTVRIRRGSFPVRLIDFPDLEYFATLRNKLMWGLRKR